MTRPVDEVRILTQLLGVCAEKLRDNEHKPDWNEPIGDTLGSMIWLMVRLSEERDELKAAIKHAVDDESEAALGEVIREAADVANFAAMIVDVACDRAPALRPPEHRWLTRIKQLEARAERARQILSGGDECER